MAGKLSESARAARALSGAGTGVREKLGEALADQYELLLETLKEGTQATRRVRAEEDGCATCGCKHRQWVTVRDTAMALKVAEFWATQGLGRPGEDRTQASAASFVVRRYVVEPPAEGGPGVAGPPLAEVDDRGLSELARRAAASAPESVERDDGERDS